MWKEELTCFTQSKYEVKLFSPRTPTHPSKHYIDATVFVSHYARRVKRPHRIHVSLISTSLSHTWWKSERRTPLAYVSWGEPQEPKRFGISPTGIKAGKEELSIDSKKLTPNVFYIFSYKDEKYVARKSDNEVVEIYEVEE